MNRRIAALAAALFAVTTAVANAATTQPNSPSGCSLRPYAGMQPLPEGSSDDMSGATTCLLVKTRLDRAPRVGEAAQLTLEVTADRSLKSGRAPFVLQLPLNVVMVAPGTDLRVSTVSSAKTDGTIGTTVTGTIAWSGGQTATRTFQLKPTAAGAGTVRAILGNPVAADPTSQSSVHITYGTTSAASYFGIDVPAIGAVTKLPTSARPMVAISPQFTHSPGLSGGTQSTLARRAKGAATSCAVGSFNYRDQNGVWRPARGVTVRAYDQNDIGGDSLLGAQLTDSVGNYRLCFDNDERSIVEAATADLYITFTLENDNFTVRRENGNDYRFKTATTNNVPSGDVNIGWLTAGNDSLQRGIHLFDELHDAWLSIPGCWDDVTACSQKQVRWSPTLDTWPAVWGSDGIARIPGPGPDSPVVVEHELGHMVMGDAYNGYWPSGDCTSPHYVSAAENAGCAWREGWPNWFAGHILQNRQQGWWSAPDNGKTDNAQVVYNLQGSSPMNTLLEDSTWGSDGWLNADYGSNVESRISNALWDYEDNAQDGPWDRKLNGFNALWDTFQHQDSGTFGEFWADLGAQGYDNTSDNALSTLYQNTIDLGGAFAFHDPLAIGKTYSLPAPPPLTLPYTATDTDNFFPFRFLRGSSCINVTAKPKGSMVVALTLYSDANSTHSIATTVGGPSPGTASIVLKSTPASPSPIIYGRVTRISGGSAYDISVSSCQVLGKASPVTIPASVLSTPLSLTPTPGGSITVTVTPSPRGSVKATADAEVSLLKLGPNPIDPQTGDVTTKLASVNAARTGKAETLRYTFPKQIVSTDEYVLVVNTLSGDGDYSISLK